MMQNVVSQVSGATTIDRGFATSPKRAKGNDFNLFLDKSIKSTARAKNVNNKSDSSKEKSISISESRDSRDSRIRKSNLSDETKKVADDRDQDVAGQILNMLNQIQNVIMEELNLTSEELDSMMTELGINLTDLIKPQALMQLLLNEEGAIDPTKILMDEELTKSFQNMLGAIEDLQEELVPELSREHMEEILAQIEVDKENDNPLTELFTKMDGSDQTQTLVNSDGSKESIESMNQVRSQGEISEVLDINNNNQAIRAMDSSSLTNANNNHLPDTAKGDEGSNHLDGFESFINNLSANYEKPILETVEDNTKIHNISDIAQQIIDRIRVMAKPGQTTMELSLNPEHLGKVNLTISSKEGIMSAGFVVENEMAKEAVEKHLIILKENLAEQGIKVDTIDVTVGSHSSWQNEQSNQDNQMTERKATRGRKITFEEANAMGEEDVYSDNSDPISNVSGYSINYQA